MKNINEVVIGTQKPVSAKPALTQDQADAVGYFFARIRVIYGHQYQVNFPDESTEKFAKREYARQVCNISRETMDEGFDALHKARQETPDEWKYLDLDKIIGLVRTGGLHWSHAVQRAQERRNAEKPKELPVILTDEQRANHLKIIKNLRKMLNT